ncbi:MAG: NAD+ synthase, partial [Nitrospirota bacterium]
MPRSNKIRIALAQINPIVGDLLGNARKIVSCIKKANTLKAEIIVFPELAITGYPPEDLLLKPQFVKDNIDALDKVRAASKNITTIVGFVDSNKGSNESVPKLFNAAAVISNSRLIDVYHKKHLPNYGVFDEYRYFTPGREYHIYELNGINIGVNICEDIWHEKGPTKVQALLGADIIININASPYHMGKASFRENLVSTRASECKSVIVYVNMIGGQDELVFDGGSFVADRHGRIIVKAGQFNDELVPVDIEIAGTKTDSKKNKDKIKSIIADGESIKKIKIHSALIKGGKPAIKVKRSRAMSLVEEVYNALLLGTGDYVRKNGFNGVVIGMSGGVDSALVASIAVDALGKENVRGLFMPSQYTSKESNEDAYATAKNLGIKLIRIPIKDIFREYLKTLNKDFKGKKTDTTEENLQARIRGNILMAFSNKFGWLVLTTGNKSEMSVGYATLYGDMAGGFAVIKDVPKTMVYELCTWRNGKVGTTHRVESTRCRGRFVPGSREGRAVIPERVLWKEPTAELKPRQRDTDTLPPYPVLDPILKAYIEEDKSFSGILKMGCDAECAQKVVRMIDCS